MTEVDWIYRRDDFDGTLYRAGMIQACANGLEQVLLQKATVAGEWTGYLLPETVLSCCGHAVESALEVLRHKAYRDGELVDEGYLRLLARIATPPLVRPWPQADWQATRKDLLHFYLLVRAEYVDLKARLQARPVSPEALHGLAEAAGKLVDSRTVRPETIEDFKKEVIRSWRRVEWSPPEDGPAVGRKCPRQRARWGSWLGRVFSLGRGRNKVSG